MTSAYEISETGKDRVGSVSDRRGDVAVWRGMGTGVRAGGGGRHRRQGGGARGEPDRYGGVLRGSHVGTVDRGLFVAAGPEPVDRGDQVRAPVPRVHGSDVGFVGGGSEGATRSFPEGVADGLDRPVSISFGVGRGFRPAGAVGDAGAGEGCGKGEAPRDFDRRQGRAASGAGGKPYGSGGIAGGLQSAGAAGGTGLFSVGSGAGPGNPGAGAAGERIFVGEIFGGGTVSEGRCAGDFRPGKTRALGGGSGSDPAKGTAGGSPNVAMGAGVVPEEYAGEQRDSGEQGCATDGSERQGRLNAECGVRSAELGNRGADAKQRAKTHHHLRERPSAKRASRPMAAPVVSMRTSRRQPSRDGTKV